MRTFIALELPNDLANEIARIARTLQDSLDGRFLNRSTYHLTLAFLGDIDEHTSRDVVAILDEVCASYAPLPLICDGLGTFGRPEDCTLWLSFTPNESLVDLTNAIRNALSSCQISYDAKSFVPHITLARRVNLKHAHLPNLPFPLPSHANTVTLFKSDLKNEGASYKPLYSKTLNTQAAESNPKQNAFDEPILDVADVVRLENMIAADGIPLSTLMNTAGLAVADAVKKVTPPPAKVCVLAGSGNNGGDGWVAAFDLAKSGYSVTLLSPKQVSELTSEPGASCAKTLFNQEQLMDSSPQIIVNPPASEAQTVIQSADIVIDALLGTGFSGGKLKEPYASWITFANTATKPHYAIAIDIPSGLNAQTGIAAAPTFRAHTTVTMLALKTGLCTPGAKEYCGNITLAPLINVTPYLEVLRY